MFCRLSRHVSGGSQFLTSLFAANEGTNVSIQTIFTFIELENAPLMLRKDAVAIASFTQPAFILCVALDSIFYFIELSFSL